MPRRVQHDSTQLRLYGCTSEDLSAKTTRSGRISYKPLEYWNFEQLNKTVDQDGHIKVVRKKTEVLSMRDKEFFPNDTSLICREPLTPKQIQSRLCTSTWTHKPVRRKGHVGSISKSNRSFVNKSGRLDSKPNHYAAEDTEKEGIPKKALSVNMKDRNKEEGSLPKPRLNISLITKSGRNSCTPVRYGMIPPDGLQNKKQVIKKYVEWAKIYPSSLFERSPKVCLKRLSPNKLRMNKAPKGIRPRMRTPKKRDHLKEKDLCIEGSLTEETYIEYKVAEDKGRDTPVLEEKLPHEKKELDALPGSTHKEVEAVVCDKPKDIPMQDKKHQSSKKKSSLTEEAHVEYEVAEDKGRDTPVLEEKLPHEKKELDALPESTHKEVEAVVCDKPKDIPMQDKKHQSRKKKSSLTEETHVEYEVAEDKGRDTPVLEEKLPHEKKELDALPGSTHKEVEAVVCDKPKDIPMQDKKHQSSKKKSSLTEETHVEHEVAEDKGRDTPVLEEKLPHEKKELDTLSGRTHKENEAVVCDKPKDVPMQDKKHRSRKKKNKLTNDENFEAVSKAADCQEAVDQEKCESMGNEVPFKDKVDKPIKQKSAEKIYHFELKELAWSDDKDSQNEASAPAVPSPEKRKKENSSRICFTSVTEAEDSSVKVTRFGRLSYKPLEYWNFERLDQEKTDEGKVKLMRNKSEIKGRKVVSKVSSQVIPETTSGPLSQRAPSPKSRKIDEPSLDSSYKEEEKIVKKFNDLKFYRLEGDKNLVVYVAQGLCMPEERIETGFIFLQKGNFVWTISAGCMKVQVLKGHGVLNLEGAEKTQRDITEGSLFHVEAGQKFTVRNHFGVESPVLKMFILKYY